MTRKQKLPIRGQQGVVLFIALIVLVAMTLAGIALVRSVDTGNQIAGNLAFRQGGVQSGDAGIEAARTALMAMTSAQLQLNQPPGYFATWQDNFDFTTHNWTANAVAVNLGNADAAGNIAYYVVHRMCQTVGVSTDPATGCITTSATATGGAQNVLSYGGFNIITAIGAPYYRITVRVVGPRKTISYVQAVIY